MRRRPIVLLTSLLVPFGLLATGLTPSGAAVTASSAAAGPTSASEHPQARKHHYRAVIRQTKHGIPHIKGKNFGDIGFGSGYMAADASACTLLDTLITGR